MRRVSLVLAGIFYCFLMYYYYRLPKTTRRLERLHYERRLFWIPFVFFLLRIWGSANRMMEVIRPEWSNPWLDMLQGASTLIAVLILLCRGLTLGNAAIGDPAQGFANALLYGLLTKQVRKRWLGICSSFLRHPSTYLLCKCCCGDDDEVTLIAVRDTRDGTLGAVYDGESQDFLYSNVSASESSVAGHLFPRSGLSIFASMPHDTTFSSSSVEGGPVISP